MGKELERTFIEELKQGRNTSYVQCKSCEHAFHGSATRIKELLFGIGVYVKSCPTPPSNIHVHLKNYLN